MLHEVLSWPAEWTALHGIAELKTPVLKAATATEVSHDLWRAAWAGTGYPAQVPAGVRFPYRAPRHLPLTSRSSFRAGLRRPFPVLPVDGGEMTPQPPDHYPAPEAPPAGPAADATSGAARVLTNDLARCFARDGFIRTPRVVPEAQVAAAASMARRLWTESGSRSGATKLIVDGIVNGQTWPAIVIPVQEGQTGDAVKAAQILMGQVPVDGDFGPQTKARVVAIQAAQKIDQDGVVGLATWRSRVPAGSPCCSGSRA